MRPFLSIDQFDEMSPTEQLFGVYVLSYAAVFKKGSAELDPNIPAHDKAFLREQAQKETAKSPTFPQPFPRLSRHLPPVLPTAALWTSMYIPTQRIAPIHLPVAVTATPPTTALGLKDEVVAALMASFQPYLLFAHSSKLNHCDSKRHICYRKKLPSSMTLPDVSARIDQLAAETDMGAPRAPLAVTVLQGDRQHVCDGFGKPGLSRRLRH
ncbi:hypothetical protein BCR44DRAFT_45485 [Catenaria anguillulae PL171]|uniref:Uncharacterized protein n=1 Tax=Catenaria anguillulae PL171 TaxID=765915 RepID=A0A1Y2HUW2_9FUNG|nr:hypothetical protein BCR44DRAFT_45485 [Catenaria anguillulae PL171]